MGFCLTSVIKRSVRSNLVFCCIECDLMVSVCAPQMTDCVTKVELCVSCTDLLDKDVGSKSDPLCVLLQSTGGDKWTEVRIEIYRLYGHLQNSYCLATGSSNNATYGKIKT